MYKIKRFSTNNQSNASGTDKALLGATALGGATAVAGYAESKAAENITAQSLENVDKLHDKLKNQSSLAIPGQQSTQAPARDYKQMIRDKSAKDLKNMANYKPTVLENKAMIQNLGKNNARQIYTGYKQAGSYGLASKRLKTAGKVGAGLAVAGGLAYGAKKLLGGNKEEK